MNGNCKAERWLWKINVLQTSVNRTYPHQQSNGSMRIRDNDVSKVRFTALSGKSNGLTAKDLVG
ncbi:hypothetical protein [Pseudoalteromonas rubra]|uniref:hypothetical protein n=1 Tax=Pseudoalteromonas rubra TaxID=43658 RepID=UPI0012FC148C|nr:hypothetical protein [Pseudoalteromonas rubra]